MKDYLLYNIERKKGVQPVEVEHPFAKLWSFEAMEILFPVNMIETNNFSFLTT